MNLNGDFKSVAIPIVSLLVGAAVVYGTMKESVDVLKDEVADNRTYVRRIDQRLSYIEGALNIKQRPFKPLLGIQND